MTNQPEQELSATAATFSDALGAILAQVIPLVSEVSECISDPDRTTRIRAEAADPADLVTDLIGQVARIGDDFDARVVSVDIDGFRAIADGVRAWGSVGLSSVTHRNVRTVSVAGLPEVTQNEHGWSIRARITVFGNL